MNHGERIADKLCEVRILTMRTRPSQLGRPRDRNGPHFSATPRDEIEALARIERLDLDVDRFVAALENHKGSARIAVDADGPDLSGVTGTPTFFVNGLRHYGTFDIDALVRAVRAARERAIVNDQCPPSAIQSRW